MSGAEGEHPGVRPGRPAILVALTLVLAAGCGPPRPEEPTAAAGEAPIGREAWEARLAEASGSPLSAPRLAELAAEAEARIERRMDELATVIEGSDDWRPVFEAIRRDFPATVEQVLATYREEVDAAADFVADRGWVTMPPARPEVAEAQSALIRRSFSLALYLNGVLGIVTAPGEAPDPAYLANHCRVCIPPLAVHEAYPGHHVAFYHAAVHRAGLAPGDPVEIRGQPENLYFHEGWGLYAELLMLQAGYYRDPARELAAWRMMLLRATRARVDPLLHSGDMTREEAVSVYVDRLLMERGAAETEVRRHLERPAGKTTYFVGLLQLQALARRVRAADPEIETRAFHDRLLRLPRRLPTLAREEFSVDLGPLAPLAVER